MAMVPWGAELADPLKLVTPPGRPGVSVKLAVGAWSGVMAMPAGPLPTAMVAPGVPLETVMGVTVLEPQLTTYAVVPLGVKATS